jgi:phosphoglycerate dehydrogenase-like enzyme
MTEINALIVEDVGKRWTNVPADVNLHFCAGDPASLDAALNDGIEILITDAMPTAADRWGGLRWVQLMSSGTDQAVNHPLRAEGKLISSAAGICAVHIAEFILARLLYHSKNFEIFQQHQSEHRWGDRVALAGPSLRGQHAVIVGYGGVGRETARMLSAMGMRITAVMRDPTHRRYDGFLPFEGIGDPDASLPERLVATADLASMLPDADAVILTVPLNRETHHLIDASTLSAFRPSAILVNVARGGVVNTDDLVTALDNRKLAHAYLDVFEQEPLSESSPVWNHPAISVTPHMAGVMPDTPEKLERLFLANLDRYRRGERLINQL